MYGEILACFSLLLRCEIGMSQVIFIWETDESLCFNVFFSIDIKLFLKNILVPCSRVQSLKTIGPSFKTVVMLDS